MNSQSNYVTSFIGIDPGKSGAIAVISSILGTFSIPFDETEYMETIRIALDEGDVFAVVEHVGAMPKQGVSSTFAFGQNFGWILGVLSSFRVPYELVRPQKWKKHFSCTSDKNTSIEVARRLFPNVNLKRTPKCSKLDDGMAEALLMASYAKHICPYYASR